MDGAIWRDDLAVVMIAAWCNVRPDQLPEAMRAHTCAATAEAWGRVAAATRDYLTTEARVTVAGRSMTVAELIAAHERAVEAGWMPRPEPGSAEWEAMCLRAADRAMAATEADDDAAPDDDRGAMAYLFGLMLRAALYPEEQSNG